MKKLKIGDLVDFEANDKTPCPNCGESLGYYADVLPENGEVKCESCGAVFSCEMERSWSGSFLRIENKEKEIMENEWKWKENDKWSGPIRREDGRIEYNCPHGIGHGNHVHGCDGCCQREDYPGRKTNKH